MEALRPARLNHISTLCSWKGLAAQQPRITRFSIAVHSVGRGAMENKRRLQRQGCTQTKQWHVPQGVCPRTLHRESRLQAHTRCWGCLGTGDGMEGLPARHGAAHNVWAQLAGLEGGEDPRRAEPLRNRLTHPC